MFFELRSLLSAHCSLISDLSSSIFVQWYLPFDTGGHKGTAPTAFYIINKIVRNFAFLAVRSFMRRMVHFEFCIIFTHI
jgi:hypothetical protein